MAVRRLKKDGLVRVNTDGRVRLTAAGRKIALKLTVRHHLIERMLAEIFGMEWYKVHDEAERLEHAVSPDFEARLRDKLGRGVACPHGNLTEVERSTPAGVSGSPRHSARGQAQPDRAQLRQDAFDPEHGAHRGSRPAGGRQSVGRAPVISSRIIIRTGFINVFQPGRHIPEGLKPAFF